MIEGLRSWIFSLAAAAICLSVLQPLIPKGTIRGIFRISSGLVLLVVALRPLLGFDPERLTLHYSDYQVEMDRQIEAYRADYEEELTDIIQRQTGAYISEKAAEMGVTCHAQVTAEVCGEVPVPTEVLLDIRHHRELEAWIHTELAIGPEAQHWEDRE